MEIKDNNSIIRTDNYSSQTDVDKIILTLHQSNHAMSEIPFKSLLCSVGEVIKKMNCDFNCLQHYLFSVLALLSAKLNDPLAVAITEDEGAGATQFLDICLKIVPAEFYIEFTDLNKDLFWRGHKSFHGRMIVAFRSLGLQKQLINIFLHLERSMLVDQKLKKENPNEIESIIIDGKLGFITILSSLKDIILSHPSVIRLHLTTDERFALQNLIDEAKNMEEYDQNLLSIKLAQIRKYFKKVEPLSVKIPYAQQILDAFITKKTNNLKDLFKNILRIIKLITIINNIPLPTNEDLYADYLGINVKIIKNIKKSHDADFAQNPLLSGKSKENISTQPTEQNSNIIQSTKVDYYYFWYIAKDVLTINNTGLTNREIRVFNALKKINLEILSSMTFIKLISDNDEDILKTLHHEENNIAWASREKIEKTVNCGGEDELSQSGINESIQQLLEKQIIDKKKDSAMKRRLVYAINQLATASKIEFPHPSDIEDPVYRGKTVLVVNPLTGDVEKI